MSTPKYDATEEQARELDAALAQLKKAQLDNKIAPTSEHGRRQTMQVLQAFGFDPRTMRQTREFGFVDSPPPPGRQGLPMPPESVVPAPGPQGPPQMPPMGGPQAGQRPAAPSAEPTFQQVHAAYLNESPEGRQAIERDPRLMATLRNPPQGSVSAQPKRVPEALVWMKKREAVDRARFMLQARMRPEKGEGKGKWVPASTFPKAVRDEMAAELGYEPAGYWTGDVGKRSRQLGDMLALGGIKEQAIEPSGARVPAAYALPDTEPAPGGQ